MWLRLEKELRQNNVIGEGPNSVELGSIKEGIRTQTYKGEKTMWGPRVKAAIHKPRREAPGETSTAHTLILDL